MTKRESANTQKPPSVAGEPYWSLAPTELTSRLGCSAEGLTSTEAANRLAHYGRNSLSTREQVTLLRLILGQLKSPLLLLLVFAATVSLFAGEWVDAAIVLIILAFSALLSATREHRAVKALAKLQQRVVMKAQVRRDGQTVTIPAEEVVPGDVVVLAAGSLIPGDGVLLTETDCFVNQAVLTGETMPEERGTAATPAKAGVAERTNCVYFGTSVRSGTATALIVATGRSTVFGGIAQKLKLRPPETEFDRGIRHFGQLLVVTMFFMVVIVFAANVLLHRPILEALLFSIALAVGLAPELLPAILAVNLANSAQMMADAGVLVRRLNAIENFGSMDVLCTDKTGTLTDGKVKLHGAHLVRGDGPAPEVLARAALNASLQAGLPNPMDEAVLAAQPAPKDAEKVGEVPYDFIRKRLSVVARVGGETRLITKGAVALLLPRCSLDADGKPLDEAEHAALLERCEAWGREGYRVLAVAERSIEQKEKYTLEDEQGLRLLGFLTFFDPPKADVKDTITSLATLGVELKIISGDSRAVAEHVAQAVGLPTKGTLSGNELDSLSDEALWHSVENTTLFVQVDPNQKERIILALKKRGHVVGYMGDGINDAPALHAADVSVSVDSAVDVAKEAADFVLVSSSLAVLRQGIEHGRTTFANTLKYVLTTTSANLGNMVSMAVASWVLPFLPLLAGQILLNNFLSDIPALALAGDAVDPELVASPRRWDMKFLQRFMLSFGVLSSLFDFLTFFVLWGIFEAQPELFRTGWFVESLLTELAVALVVRTRRPFFRSRPSTALMWLSLGTALVALVIPFLPYASVLGFVPLPAGAVAAIIGITGLYVLATEALKRVFYARLTNR